MTRFFRGAFVVAFVLLAVLPGFAEITRGQPTDFDAATNFNVQAYVLDGLALPATNNLASLLARHTGPNLGVEELANAAADVQSEYARQGFPAVTVAIAKQQIANGLVTLHVFQGACAQILISGRRYAGPANTAVVAQAPAPAPNQPPTAPANAAPARLSRTSSIFPCNPMK